MVTIENVPVIKRSVPPIWRIDVTTRYECRHVAECASRHYKRICGNKVSPHIKLESIQVDCDATTGILNLFKRRPIFLRSPRRENVNVCGWVLFANMPSKRSKSALLGPSIGEKLTAYVSSTNMNGNIVVGGVGKKGHPVCVLLHKTLEHELTERRSEEIIHCSMRRNMFLHWAGIAAIAKDKPAMHETIASNWILAACLVQGSLPWCRQLVHPGPLTNISRRIGLIREEPEIVINFRIQFRRAMTLSVIGVLQAISRVVQRRASSKYQL